VEGKEGGDMQSQSKIQNPKSKIPPRAFTLMELLIVMMIMTLLAGLALSALAGATEAAREQRTRAIIAKIDQLIMERYESYRTRAVPIRITADYVRTNGKTAAARMRLNALRELMRMELPDRRTDIAFLAGNPPTLEPAVVGFPPSIPTMPIASLQRSYFRTAVRTLGGNPSVQSTYTVLSKWTQQNEGSECLYLILSSMQDGDKNALDYFGPEEIGDTDNDGMKEVLDAWGEPIHFLRWAPGFVIQNDGAITTQTADATTASDPFDPAKADARWSNANEPIKPYALRPLIFSSGRDRVADIATILVTGSNADFRYTQTPTPNDPYYIPTTGNQKPIGTPYDADQDGEFAYQDNITNHFVQTP
jgi:prepilin-type N-terminal cleavage/methylation domain-containing protein